MRGAIPLLMALTGVLGGAGAGYFLHPETPVVTDPAAPDNSDHAPSNLATELGTESEGHGETEGGANVEYVKLNNQFVVPVIRKGTVASLVVISLSLEVTSGGTARVYEVEPKLRDALLQVLFDHANVGGFDGDFTDTARMNDLRDALAEATRRVLGKIVLGVLISDIARQDAA